MILWAESQEIKKNNIKKILVQNLPNLILILWHFIQITLFMILLLSSYFLVLNVTRKHIYLKINW